jgi:hypothetical protein
VAGWISAVPGSRQAQTAHSVWHQTHGRSSFEDGRCMQAYYVTADGSGGQLFLHKQHQPRECVGLCRRRVIVTNVSQPIAETAVPQPPQPKENPLFNNNISALQDHQRQAFANIMSNYQRQQIESMIRMQQQPDILVPSPIS